MKRFIVCISALVLTIFIAAISAVIFLSFTVSALVVAIASGGDSTRPPDNSADSAIVSAISASESYEQD